MAKQNKKRKVKSKKEIDFTVFQKLIEKNKEPLKVPDLEIMDYPDSNGLVC